MDHCFIFSNSLNKTYLHLGLFRVYSAGGPSSLFWSEERDLQTTGPEESMTELCEAEDNTVWPKGTTTDHAMKTWMNSHHELHKVQVTSQHNSGWLEKHACGTISEKNDFMSVPEHFATLQSEMFCEWLVKKCSDLFEIDELGSGNINFVCITVVQK